MIEIKNRFTGAAIFRSETATIIAEAVTEFVAQERAAHRIADLSRADLGRADLSGANLSGAYLGRADLSSLGFDERGYHFLLYFEANQCVVRAGCRVYSMAEARGHWADKPEILARLDLGEAIAKIRGWE